MMDQMDVYNHLPLYLQNMVCSLEGRRIQRKRYSKEFHIFLSDYRNRNEWSYDQLCEYRDERLRRMVKHCYESVEYYNKIFNESGVHYKNIKRLDDLKKIPILDKETVLQNYEQFIAKNISRRQMVTAHTSGTTGSAKGVLLSNEGIIASSLQLISALTSREAIRFLAIIPFFSSYGFVDGMNATLGNKMTITLIPQYKPSHYTKLILKHKPNVIISVPKLWEDMAYTLKNKRVNLSYIVYPISGGDKITAASVETINNCFFNHGSKAKLLIGYGLSEFGAAISITIPNMEFETGSVGAIMPIANIKIINPKTNEELSYEENGEICINAQSMMLGYFVL